MSRCPTTCGEAPALRLPSGLASAILERTGVAVTFYLPDGTRASEEGGAAVAEPAPALAIEAAGTNAERFESGPGEVRLAWPIYRRSRLALVAMARVPACTPEAEGTGRRLLAAVADLVRARMADAAASADRDATTEALTQCYEEITLLHELGDALRVNRPLAEFLEHVCSELRETIGAQAVAAWLSAAAGVEPLTVVAGRLPLLVSDVPALVERVLAGLEPERPVLIHNHVQDDPTIARFSIALERLVMVPLSVGGKGCGAIAAFNRAGGEFGSPDAKLICSGAASSAVFVDNRRLYVELQQLMLDLVRSLVSSVDAKDPYTCGHSTRVAITCREVARALGFGDEPMREAYMAGLLHDVGKIGTPEAILRKPGLLLPEECEIMQRHSQIGAQILGGIRKLESIREAVLHHHEHMDGSGYPAGLKGDAIPLLARIIALADAFDAMTSNRPYRPMMPWQDVKREIEQGAGTQFDPQVAQALLAQDFGQLMQQFTDSPTQSGLDARAPLRVN
jgi:putative nucleotidyltransferase with HDIG domain